MPCAEVGVQQILGLQQWQRQTLSVPVSSSASTSYQHLTGTQNSCLESSAPTTYMSAVVGLIILIVTRSRECHHTNIGSASPLPSLNCSGHVSAHTAYLHDVEVFTPTQSRWGSKRPLDVA